MLDLVFWGFRGLGSWILGLVVLWSSFLVLGSWVLVLGLGILGPRAKDKRAKKLGMLPSDSVVERPRYGITCF